MIPQNQRQKDMHVQHTNYSCQHCQLHYLMALASTSILYGGSASNSTEWPHVWSNYSQVFWLWYKQKFGNKTKHWMHDGRHWRWNGQTLPCCRSSHSESSIYSMFDTVFVMLSRSSGLTHRSAIRTASSKICRTARSPAAAAAATLLHLHQILRHILQKSTLQQTSLVLCIAYFLITRG